MDRKRLEAIEEERKNRPAVWHKDAPSYYLELLPLAICWLDHEDRAKEKTVVIKEVLPSQATKKVEVPVKRATIHSPAKKITPKKRIFKKKKK